MEPPYQSLKTHHLVHSHVTSMVRMEIDACKIYIMTSAFYLGQDHVTENILLFWGCT